MFLEVLRRRNPDFVDAVIRLHRAGEIPAGSYAVDLDAVTRNSERLRSEADRLGLEVFGMTKQVSRGEPFLAAMRDGGIASTVAVDMQCALATERAGLRLGHVGHLVQVPRREAATAAALEPENWTVFDQGKATEAAAASDAGGRTQAILARIVGAGDRFYPGHEGGFDADEVLAVADAVDALPGARFAGVTTFPAALFDREKRRVVPTPNLATLEAAAARLAAAGRADLRVNAPGTTSVATLSMLADAGATQVEPGHALTGTTPAHAFADLPEEPAALYVSEISHHAAGRAYCFGGGLYVDPVFEPYAMKALVAEGEGEDARLLVEAELPPPAAIDYYGMLTPPQGRRLAQGATVLFGYRIQAFVTRSPVVGVAGVSAGEPRAVAAWRHDGSALKPFPAAA
ncbi:MAG: alanine racemase [Solirubrobacterales bacterium]